MQTHKPNKKGKTAAASRTRRCWQQQQQQQQKQQQQQQHSKDVRCESERESVQKS